MRTKKVTRYFCDHCGKGSLRSFSTLRHESICFRNPNRKCFLCENAQPISELKKHLSCGDPTFADLRKATGNCPACILATILQLVPKGQRVHGEDHWFEFDYKKEKDEWLAAERRQFAGSVGPMVY